MINSWIVCECVHACVRLRIEIPDNLYFTAKGFEGLLIQVLFVKNLDGDIILAALAFVNCTK
jgi:hypothetical protein